MVRPMRPSSTLHPASSISIDLKIVACTAYLFSFSGILNARQTCANVCLNFLKMEKLDRSECSMMDKVIDGT